ncbi:MAG: histidine--tRNA ligase [Myxococcota bacterium]
MSKLRAVKGMNDWLPADARRHRVLEDTFRRVAGIYGYGEVRTPLVEPTPLFVRSIGEVTDIVEKEMYTFEDKGGKTLTLRPEGTASCVRAYLQHNVQASGPVTKWFYSGPMYRRERPAKGRYRQFHQVGCELYGDAGPFGDAELIDLAHRFLTELGIEGPRVLLNSLGSGDTRQRYRDALLAFLKPRAAELSEDSQRRLERNPLRVLDSKAPQDQEVSADAPSILEFLSQDDQTHFDDLRRTLDQLKTPYEVQPRLVRGLDYYTRTLFELKGGSADLGSQDTLCGGGRYDGMVEQLGGPPTPAIGFAMGVERLLLSMAEGDPSAGCDAFLVVTPAQRQLAVGVLSQLRSAGLRVDSDIRGGSLKSQFRRADKSGAPFALVLGDDEASAGTLQVKDLREGTQTAVAVSATASHVLENLKAP